MHNIYQQLNCLLFQFDIDDKIMNLENKVPKGQGLIQYLMVICFFNVLEHIVSLY